MIAIRGATSVERDEPEHITSRVCELFDRILAINDIEQLIAITFSVTPDIRTANPATIVRTKYDLPNLALMCFQEAIFNDSAQKIIRLMIFCEGQNNHFVYLHRAAHLRSDSTKA